MADAIDILDASTQLSRLVERVEAGEDIVIARAGRPVARLVPFRERREPRQPGLLKGKIGLESDWDSPAVNAEIAELFDRRRCDLTA